MASGRSVIWASIIVIFECHHRHLIRPPLDTSQSNIEVAPILEATDGLGMT